MKRISKLALLITMVGSMASAQQSDLLERNFSGVSKEATPVAARKDIQDQAAMKVSEEVIKDLIGEERFSRNKSLIVSKIIKNSGRYIPFVKPSEILPEGEGFKMSVMMKVSLKDLKQLLQNNSLLSENDAAPVVLPMVSWTNRIEGKSYRWWLGANQEESAFLNKQSRRFEDSLRASFRKNNFFVLKPQEAGLNQSIPADFQSEKVSSDDSQFFAQYYNAPLLVDGQIQFEKGEKGKFTIEIHLAAMQVSNGRTMADVSRRFETESGQPEIVIEKKMKEVAEAATNDLSSQVFEAWQRGSLGTSVVRVTLKGKSTLPMMENFKNKVRTQITQVKNIRERLVTSDTLSFEVDTSVNPSELAAKLASLNIDGKMLSKVSESSNEVVLKWNE